MAPARCKARRPSACGPGGGRSVDQLPAPSWQEPHFPLKARAGSSFSRRPRPAEHGQRAVRARGQWARRSRSSRGTWRRRGCSRSCPGQLGLEQAPSPQPFAQVLHQHGVFGPALAQMIAHAVQHSEHGGKVGPGLSAICSRRQRRLDVEGGGPQRAGPNWRGVGQRLVGQRLRPVSARLALGAALELAKGR